MTSKIIGEIGKIYSKVLDGIGALIIILVAISMIWMGFSRTVFNTPWSALDRINTIAIIWACFIISGLLVLRDEHISVTFLITKLEGLKLYILKLVIHLIVLVTYCIVAYFGYSAFEIIYETGVFYPAEIDIPQWLAIFPIFLGMVLGIPFVLYVLIVDIIDINNAVTRKNLKGGNA